MEPPKNQRLSIRRPRLSTPETKNPFDAIDATSPIQSPEIPMLSMVTERKDQEEVKEVELVQFKQKPVLKKSIKDGFSSYNYSGPLNQDIQHFLDDLYQREGPVSAQGLFYRLSAWNKKVDKHIEKYLPLNCIDGPLAVNKDSLVLFLMMMICSAYFAISIGNCSEPKEDSLKFFKEYGPGSTFIFTFYGLIFFSLPAVLAFAIAVAQILIPLFFILFDENLIFTRNNVPSLDAETLVIRIAITVPAIAWGLLYVPYWLLRRHVGRITSHLFIAAVYVGIFLCAMGLPILKLLQTNGRFDSDFFKENTTTIYLLSVFFILFSWLIIHFKFFWVPTRDLEFTLMNLAKKEARKPVPPHKISQQQTLQNDVKIPTFKDKVYKHIYWISSIACGGAYMGIEMYLLTKTIQAFKEDETNGFIASLFFLLASPIFLLIGIPLALTRIRARNKSLVLPLITIVPMFGIVPLAEALADYQSGEDLKFFFIVGPPTAIFFWLAMAFIGLKKRKIFYGIFTFSCLFLFLPFVFLGLGQSDYFSNVKTQFFGAFYGLISTFAAGLYFFLGFLLVRYVYRFIKKKIQEGQRKRDIERAYLEKLRKIQKKRKQLARSKTNVVGSNGENEEIDEEELDELELDEFDHSLANIEQVGLVHSPRKKGSQGSLPSLVKGVSGEGSGADNKIKRSQTKTKSITKANLSSKKVEGESAGSQNHQGILSMLVIEEEQRDPQVKKRGLFGGKSNDNKEKEKDKTKQKMSLNVLKEIELKKKLQLLAIIYMNFKNLGFWINASAFIVSYTFIAYAYFNMSDSVTDTEHGILLGVTIVIPVMFIVNNLLIRLKTAKLSDEERKVYEKKDKMEKIFFESELQRDMTRLRKASMIQALVLLFGCLLIPIIQIPFFFVFDDRIGRVANLIIMIICIFYSLFVAGIIEVKKRSGPFHKFFVPSFISLFWIIVILPFVVIIPLVAAVLVTYSNNFKTFVKLSLVSSAFLLMFGVTSFAILFNVIFQKIEKEKLIKFLIKSLGKFLKEHAVKADDVVLRRLIEEYLKKENEEEVEKLKRSLIDDRIPIVPIYPPKFKVTPNFSAGLLLIDTYYKIMQKSQQMKNKGSGEGAIKQKESCWTKLARLCGDSEDLDEDFEGVKEIPNLDDSYFKADHYLPGDFDENIWNYALGDFDSLEKPPALESDRNPNLMTIDLGLKLTDDDIKLRDHMTPILEAVMNIPLTSSEIKNLNHCEHALILNNSNTQTEIWYQHVYDYFSGKTPPYDDNGSSQGMIYQNYTQFIRITQLDKENEISQEFLDALFANFAKKKLEKAHCLAYNGFIQALVEISYKIFSETLHEEKNLRRFTKKIYPPIMARIQDINKVYSGSLMTFTKPRAPYVPHLDLFDKRRDSQHLNFPQKDDRKKPISPPFPQESSYLPMETSNFEFQKGEPVSFGRRDLSRKSYTSAAAEEIVQERRTSIFPAPRTIPNTQNTPKAHHLSFNLSQDGVSPKNASQFKRMSASDPNTPQKKKPTTKATCLRLLLSIQKCWNSFYAKMGACLYHCCFVAPKAVGDWVYRKTKRVGKTFGFDIDEGSDSDDDMTIRRVAQEAPAWPILVDKIFSLLPRSITVYFQSQREKEILLQFNLTNVTTILGKISEIYTYISLAFRPQVPWFSSNSASDVILIVAGESSWFNSFKFLFWLGVGLAFLYLIVSIPAIHALRKGKLGEDEFGKKASFPHPQFFLTFAVTILGASLFPQVMRYLLYAFVCNYTALPWTLARDTSIQCLSDEHALYMGIGTLALLIYYPISTFMFPNFQFQNKVLDLKYDPSFVVLTIQAKLLISAFTSFFKPVSNSDTESVKIQLIGCACVLFCLAFLTFLLKPCLIKRANVWDISAYSLAFWVQICALVVIYTDKAVIGFIMLGIGTVGILGLAIFVLKKFYGRRQRKKDHQVATVRYHANKRRAKVENDADKDRVNEIMQAVERQNRKQALEYDEYFADDYYETQKGAII